MSHPARLISLRSLSRSVRLYQSKTRDRASLLAKPVEGWGHDFTAGSVQGFPLSFRPLGVKSLKAYIR